VSRNSLFFKNPANAWGGSTEHSGEERILGIEKPKNKKWESDPYNASLSTGKALAYVGTRGDGLKRERREMIARKINEGGGGGERKKTSCGIKASGVLCLYP